jgi:hypothetical protein
VRSIATKKQETTDIGGNSTGKPKELPESSPLHAGA